MNRLSEHEYSQYMKRYTNHYLSDKVTPFPKGYTTFLYDLSRQPDQHFIDIAIERNRVCLNEEAVYVKVLHDHETYKSLIFHADGTIIKTRETTSAIMLRFFEHNRSPYSLHSDLGKLLNIRQKCPYILNNVCYAPDAGFTKNNVNWIGLHHVNYYAGDQAACSLKTSAYSEIILPISLKRIHKMIHNSSILAIMHQAILHHIMSQYAFLDNQTSKSNVITDYIRNIKHQTPLPNPFEVYQYMEQQRVITMVKQIMGIDYPTKEELEIINPKLQTFLHFLDTLKP